MTDLRKRSDFEIKFDELSKTPISPHSKTGRLLAKIRGEKPVPYLGPPVGLEPAYDNQTRLSPHEERKLQILRCVENGTRTIRSIRDALDYDYDTARKLFAHMRQVTGELETSERQYYLTAAGVRYLRERKDIP